MIVCEGPTERLHGPGLEVKDYLYNRVKTGTTDNAYVNEEMCLTELKDRTRIKLTKV